MTLKSSFKTIPLQARIAVISLGLAGLLAAFGAIMAGHQWPAAQSLLFVALGIATARIKVSLTGSSTISALTSVVLLAMMVGGAGIAVIVGICGVTTQTVFPARKLVFHQLAFNAGMIAVTVAAASGAFQRLVRGAEDEFAEQFLAALIASLIYFFCNSAFVALIIGLSKRKSPVEIWRKHMPSTAPSFLIAGMVSLCLFRALLSPVAGLFFVTVPVVASVYCVSVWLSRRPLQALQER